MRMGGRGQKPMTIERAAFGRSPLGAFRRSLLGVRNRPSAHLPGPVFKTVLWGGKLWLYGGFEGVLASYDGSAIKIYGNDCDIAWSSDPQYFSGGSAYYYRKQIGIFPTADTLYVSGPFSRLAGIENTCLICTNDGDAWTTIGGGYTPPFTASDVHVVLNGTELCVFSKKSTGTLVALVYWSGSAWTTIPNDTSNVNTIILEFGIGASVGSTTAIGSLPRTIGSTYYTFNLATLQIDAGHAYWYWWNPLVGYISVQSGSHPVQLRGLSSFGRVVSNVYQYSNSYDPVVPVTVNGLIYNAPGTSQLSCGVNGVTCQHDGHLVFGNHGVIKQWNSGSSYTTLATFDGYLYGLESFNGEIYACGSFPNPTTSEANYAGLAVVKDGGLELI